MMTGLLVTILHFPVARLPTTQNSPSAKLTVPDASSKHPAKIKRFMALAPAMQVGLRQAGQ
jgi:hypothetical protein